MVITTQIIVIARLVQPDQSASLLCLTGSFPLFMCPSCSSSSSSSYSYRWYSYSSLFCDRGIDNTSIIQAGLKILFCIISSSACIISVLLTRASVTDVLLYRICIQLLRYCFSRVVHILYQTIHLCSTHISLTKYTY